MALSAQLAKLLTKGAKELMSVPPGSIMKHEPTMRVLTPEQEAASYAPIRTSSYELPPEELAPIAPVGTDEVVPLQEVTSKKTSRKQIPALFKSNLFDEPPGSRNLDLGGGRYTLGTDWLKKNKDIDNSIVDKYWKTEEENNSILKQFENDPADSVTINNVLNVIKEQNVRRNIIEDSFKYLNPNKKAYFQIYEGDGKEAGSGVGRETKDGWQNYKKTKDYLTEVEEVYGKGNVEKKGKNILIATKSPQRPALRQQVEDLNLSKEETDVVPPVREEMDEVVSTDVEPYPELSSRSSFESYSSKALPSDTINEVSVSSQPKLGWWLDGEDIYFFHGTNKKNIPSINEKGILPAEGEDYVSLALDPQTAHGYAAMSGAGGESVYKKSFRKSGAKATNVSHDDRVTLLIKIPKKEIIQSGEGPIKFKEDFGEVRGTTKGIEKRLVDKDNYKSFKGSGTDPDSTKDVDYYRLTEVRFPKNIPRKYIVGKHTGKHTTAPTKKVKLKKGKTREEIELQGGPLSTKLNEQKIGRILDEHNIEWEYNDNGGITAIEEFSKGPSRKKYFKRNTSLKTVRDWLGYAKGGVVDMRNGGKVGAAVVAASLMASGGQAMDMRDGGVVGMVQGGPLPPVPRSRPSYPIPDGLPLVPKMNPLRTEQRAIKEIVMASTLKEIADAEGTEDQGYNIVFGTPRGGSSSRFINPTDANNKTMKLTSMTLKELDTFQRKLINATRDKVNGVQPGYGTSAVGKYQVTRPTLELARTKLGYSRKEWNKLKYTPELQEQIGRVLLEHRGIDKMLEGKMTPKKFRINLSNEWASIPGKTKKVGGQPTPANVGRIEGAFRKAVNELKVSRDSFIN
jgi:hypothetical protein